MIKKYNNFLERVKNLIISFDFIGPTLSFQNGNSSTFQSIPGTIWSFLAFIFLGVATYFFGKECYLRQSPNTSSNTENVEYSNIFFNEFPFIFSFVTPNGFSLNETNFNSYFEPFITYISYDENGILSYNMTKITKFVQCDIAKFKRYTGLVSSMIGSNENGMYMCLDFGSDDYFSNTFFNFNSTNWNIGLKPCRVNCAEDQLYVINGMLLNIRFLTSFVDLSNYLNPISIFPNSVTYQLDYSMLRRTYLRFIYNILKSDNGWLVNDVVTTDFPSLDSVVPDDMIRFANGPYKDTLFIVALESPNLRISFYRSYLKITQVMANVGGLSHSLILFVKILADPHLKFIMSIFIREAAIKSLEKNDLEMSMSNNIKEKKISNKNLIFNKGGTKVATYINNEKGKALENSQKRKIIDESSCSDMKIENKFDVNVNAHSQVQTVIKFSNQVNPMAEVIKNTEIIDKDQSPNKKNDESLIKKEKLDMLATKFSYFSHSVIHNLKESKGGESFLDYFLAHLCCRRDKIRYYRIQLKATRKLLSIHTYTNMIIKDSNHEEFDVYDSLRAHNNK